MKTTTQIHPAEVGTSALILAVLFGVVSCLAGRSQTIETEDFKGFHIPAKHTIDSGTFVLYDGVVINGKTVRMNPHMVFVAMDYWDPGAFELLGEQPPLMHDQSIMCVGGHPKIWIYFDVPVRKISFDVRSFSPLVWGIQVGWPFSEVATITEETNRVAFESAIPVDLFEMYGGGYTYGPIAISNIEIEY